MAAQWFIPSGAMPLSGVMVDEDGTDEYFIPGLGMFNEDQAAAAGGGVFQNTDEAMTGGTIPMSGGMQ